MTSIQKLKANATSMNYDDFHKWLTNMGIPGLAIGAIIGAQLNEMVRSFSITVLAPVIASLQAAAMGQTFSLPSFDFSLIIASTLSFVITMGILYALKTTFNLAAMRPIQLVYRVKRPDWLDKSNAYNDWTPEGQAHEVGAKTT